MSQARTESAEIGPGGLSGGLYARKRPTDRAIWPVHLGFRHGTRRPAELGAHSTRGTARLADQRAGQLGRPRPRRGLGDGPGPSLGPVVGVGPREAGPLAVPAESETCRTATYYGTVPCTLDLRRLSDRDEPGREFAIGNRGQELATESGLSLSVFFPRGAEDSGEDECLAEVIQSAR